MKKAVILLFCLLFLLCSCNDFERKRPVTDTETETAAETKPSSPDILPILDLSRFSAVYDETLDADWLTYNGMNEGLFVRIVAYSDKDASLRLVCTEADKLIHNGRIYEIPNGSTAADDSLMTVLSEIADGGDCYFNNRAITADEREALSASIQLFKSSAAYKKQSASQPEQVTTDSDGNHKFDNGKFSIGFPSSFDSSWDGERLVIISGLKKLRAVSVVKADTAFSSNIAEEEAIRRKVESSGGKLTSDVTEAAVGGRAAYRYAYEKNGAYITQFCVDGGDCTYILTGISYDKSDRIPSNIISTFKLIK